MNQANWTVIQAKIHRNTTMRFKPKINNVCSLQIQARKSQKYNGSCAVTAAAQATLYAIIYRSHILHSTDEVMYKLSSLSKCVYSWRIQIKISIHNSSVDVHRKMKTARYSQKKRSGEQEEWRAGAMDSTRISSDQMYSSSTHETEYVFNSTNGLRVTLFLPTFLF